MKIQHKIISASIIIGVFIWIIDAILDFLFLHEGAFLEVLIYDIHTHHLYIRLIGMGSFLIFGIIIAKIMALRKKAEDDLKCAHSDLDQIFNASVPLCVIRKDFKMLRVNNTFCNFFGLKREEILGKKCHEIWEDKFCNTVECPLMKVMDGAKEYEGEVEKKLSNGKTVSCIVTAIPYRSPTGELLGVVENFTDITDRKLAEETINHINTELNQIFSTAADGMRVIDKEFNVLRINETLSNMSGISKDEAVGKKCDKTFHGSFCHTANCPLTRILNGEERVEYDVEKEKIDGTIIPCIVTATPFRNATGELIGIVEDFKDITERKKAEKELEKHRFHLEKLIKERTVELTNANEQLHREIEERIRAQKDLKESEIKYSTLVEQAKDWVVIIQDGICKFSNKAIKGLLGYTVEEMIEKPLSDIIISECKDLDTQKSKPCCITSGKVNLACETKMKHKDGRIIDLEASTGIIQYNGKPSTLGIIRNVTERKKMEEELQKLEKLEAVGLLAGGIAHDFNNLLTAIIGNLSLAELYIKPEDKAYKTLASAKKASKHASQLTQQLLTFSKGGVPIKETASISELIEDTASFALRGSNVRCEYSIPEDLWLVEIDKGQISQVINNLVMNANHAMPKGGVIGIDAENVLSGAYIGLSLKEGKYIKISVKDEGIGIPVKYLPKIFDPYFTTKEDGNGLGLATCYSIINKHGGYITVESEMGVGTTFYIYLPASEQKRFEMQEIEEEKPYLGHGKILFMDDEEEVIDIAAEMLTQLGYEIVSARNGTEAIELYKKANGAGEPIEAVILDLTIPGDMGGKEAIQKLREIDPQVKAIVSSGYSNDPVMSEYMSYGFNSVIAKPYEVKELSKVLYRVIKDSQLLGPQI